MTLSAQEIKALKEIEKPFGRLDEKTRDMLIKLNEDVRVYGCNGEWSNHGLCFHKQLTYALRQDYPEPKSYEERQADWIKENDIKVGDRVKIVINKGNIWMKEWLGDMQLGDVVKIKSIDNGEIKLKGLRRDFIAPYFVLEKVVEQEKKYLWVAKIEKGFKLLTEYRTEKEIIQLCKEVGYMKFYAKLIDCQREDGSIEESKFIEIK